jgi:hypothetical protein
MLRTPKPKYADTILSSECPKALANPATIAAKPKKNRTQMVTDTKYLNIEGIEAPPHLMALIISPISSRVFGFPGHLWIVVGCRCKLFKKRGKYAAAQAAYSSVRDIMAPVV